MTLKKCTIKLEKVKEKCTLLSHLRPGKTIQKKKDELCILITFNLVGKYLVTCKKSLNNIF